MKNIFRHISNNKEMAQCNVSAISYKENQNFQSHIGAIKCENGRRNQPATFEEAIEATEFGKFNYILMLVAFPCALATSFDSTTLSFVIPRAHCDLELTLFKKGALNAITYCGMITSAFIWGFLADTLGRKKLLVLGFSLAACFDFLAMFSVNYWMLLFAKYCNGLCICGPFAVLMSYISEMHCTKHRAKIVLFSGICFSSTNIILPCLAWLILPRDISYTLFDGFYTFYAWKLFLGICALPATLAAFLMSRMPESPKFLMTMGRNSEALKIFQMIYTKNTGNPPDSYPIKELLDERGLVDAPIISFIGGHRESTVSNSSPKKVHIGQKITDGWRQIRPLFAKPYVGRISLVFVMQFMGMMGVNTLRLWLPQIFTITENYNTAHPTEPASLCQMMEQSPITGISKPTDGFTLEEPCVAGEMNDQIFINFIILGVVQGTLYMFASNAINLFGKRNLLASLFCLSGMIGFGFYFANSSLTTLILSSLFCALTSICVTTIISVCVELIPTSLRTMTISLTMMCGRTGALSGNLIFPVLLQMGCLPPFLLIGGMTLLCGILSMFLPKTDMKPLV